MENNENKTPVTEEKKEEVVQAVEEPKKEEAAPAEEVKKEEAKAEIPAENKEGEKPEKKEKKSLFAKEKKPWEEEKKREPLEKQDYICIAGFIILLLIAFLPYFLRFLDPAYDDTKKFSLKGEEESTEDNTPKSRKKLTCTKEGVAEGFTYSANIVNTYENAVVKTNDITYTIIQINDATLTNDTVEVEDYKKISEIPSEGIQTTHEVGTAVYKIIINYDTDESLRSNNELSDHFKGFGIQKGDYEQKGFTCSEEKLEG